MDQHTKGSPNILAAKIPEDKRLHHPRTIISRADGLAGGEHLDFSDCIRLGGSPYAPAAVGHRTASIAHIGNIAMQLGRKLRWNPDQEKFLADNEANAMLSRSQREPWTIENIDS